jgi:uncharacterized protein YdeI (BOF family)
MKYTLIILLVIVSALLNAQATYLDSVEELVNSGKEGQVVALKGEYVVDDKTISYSLKDNSGTIPINISSIRSQDLQQGDAITINGKLKENEKGNLYVMVSYLRKNSYVKDPSHCCMPSFD